MPDFTVTQELRDVLSAVAIFLALGVAIGIVATIGIGNDHAR